MKEVAVVYGLDPLWDKKIVTQELKRVVSRAMKEYVRMLKKMYPSTPRLDEGAPEVKSRAHPFQLLHSDRRRHTRTAIEVPQAHQVDIV